MLLSARRMARTSILRTMLAAGLLSGCYSTNSGPEPPVTTLYYPTAMALSPKGSALYIANSDFDLQYNAGTVLALDIRRAREMLAPVWDPARWGAVVAAESDQGAEAKRDLCAAAGLQPNANSIVFPGPCAQVDLASPPDDPSTSLVRAVAKVGAFATRLLYVCQPAAGDSGRGARCEDEAPTQARLFAIVRGDPSLTYFEVDDDRGDSAQTFRLDCGQGANGGRCDSRNRLGTDSNDNSRAMVLPSEPFDGAVSDGGEAIVLTHQNAGTLSLFAAEGPTGTTIFDKRPVLQSTVATDPKTAAMGIASIPIPALARTPNPSSGQSDLLNGVYRPGFVVDYRSSAKLDLVRYVNDGDAAPNRPYLSALGLSAVLPITANASGSDSRGIVIDRWERDSCEKACPTSADVLACHIECSRMQMPVYVTNRAPATLLVGRTVVETVPGQVGASEGATTYNELVSFYDAVPLATGPSRAVLGTIRNALGVAERRVFIVCFDSRTIVVYDPARRQVEAEVRTGRGPQDLVLDPILPLAYVAHFTDSYIGVLDLDESHSVTFETMVAGIGLPIGREVSK